MTTTVEPLLKAAECPVCKAHRTPTARKCWHCYYDFPVAPSPRTAAEFTVALLNGTGSSGLHFETIENLFQAAMAVGAELARRNA